MSKKIYIGNTIIEGTDGKSAYQSWLDQGNIGTEEEFVNSLKGRDGTNGIRGPQGNTGSSIDYPFELINNLTTDDPTKGLSAAQGVVLDDEIKQVNNELTDIFGEHKVLASADMTTILYTITSNTWRLVPSNVGGRYYEVTQGQRVIMTANENRECLWAFVSSLPTADGEAVSYVDDGYKKIGVGETTIAEVPTNCYLYIRYRTLTNNANYWPSFIQVSTKWVKTEQWDTNIQDVDSVKTKVENLYGKQTTLTPPKKENGIIRMDGTVDASNNYRITEPIAVKRGEKIVINSYIPKDSSGLAITDTESSFYTPVISNTGNGKVDVREYIATEDCYVAWCYINTQVHEMSIENAIDIYSAAETKELVDETFGKTVRLYPAATDDQIIRDDGRVDTPANHYHISEPVPVKRGQKITITSYIAKNSCALALTDSESSYYTPVLVETGNGKVATREYVAPEDCLVAWCYNDSKVYEMYISAAVNMLELYDILALKNESGILDFNPSVEFTPKFIAAKKATNNVTPLVLLAFSDIHSKALENLPRILEFQTAYSSYIDEVINLGDMVSNQFSNDFVFGEIDGAENILSIIGNHDTATSSGGVYDWTAHAGVDSYTRYLAPFISNWNVNQPNNAEENGYCYYYKDYQTQGIRIVFLDVMGYDATQEAWLDTILSDARTNSLSVLIAAHYAGAKVVGYDSKYSPLVNNYIDRPSYNSSFYSSVSVAESFVNEGGELIGWIIGHTHRDLIGKLEGTNQVCLVVDTAQFGTYAVNPECDRIEGTPTQDAFSIISIDTQAKTLSTFKVGCRRDKWQRQQDSICVNYETATLLGDIKGSDGKSAYQSWLDQGNTGTEEAFVESLKGRDGKDGKDGEPGLQGNTGSSIDYPFELVNNLTTEDATKGLSALQGRELDLRETMLEKAYAEKMVIDCSSLSVRNFSISTTGKFGTSSTYKHSRVDVSPYDVVRITAPSEAITRICFTTSIASGVSGGDIPLCSGTSVVELSAGTSRSFTAPSDAVSIFVYRGASPYANTPLSLSIETSRVKSESLPENSKATDIPSMGTVADAVVNNGYITKVINVSSVERQSLSISLNNTFESTGSHSLIAVGPKDILKVIGNGGRVAFVSAFYCPNADSSVAAITTYVLEVGKTYVLNAPDNAVGFIYNTAEGENDVTPSEIQVSTPKVEESTFTVIPCGRFGFSGGEIIYAAASSNKNYLLKVKANHSYSIKFTANATASCAFLTDIPRIGLTYTSFSPTQNVNTINKENTLAFTPESDGYYLIRVYKSSSPSLEAMAYDADSIFDGSGDVKDFWRYNISALTRRNYMIDASNGLYGSSTSYKHVLIPVNPGQKIRIIKGENKARFAWFTSDEAPVANGVPAYVPGTCSVTTDGGVYTAPAGANYLWIYSGDATNSYWPSYVGIEIDYASIPDIVMENDYAKTRRILFQIGSQTRTELNSSYKPLVLLHYSDIHGRTGNQTRINEFREFWKDYIDDTIQTGDLVADDWADASAFGDETVPEVNPSRDILSLIGNHDTAYKSGGETIWHYYEGKQAYDRYIGPYVSNWEVTQPADASENGLCYYYKDYSNSGIRLVAIDAWNSNADYQTAQQAWFADVLNDAKINNLSVIVASHFRIKCETLLQSPFTLPSAATSNPDSSSFNDPYVAIVKSFIDEGGKFVCWLTGHSHYDAISKTSADLGSQINICVNRAGAYGSSATLLWQTDSRVNVDFSDWKTFDCFNIMAVDTYYKYITLFRIGSNWDKMGRKIETCCINYDTGEMLY